MKNILTLIFIFSLLFLTESSYSQVTYFVDGSRPDNDGDGTTWATAKKDILEAINLATEGSQVWIKRGTYFPATTLSMKYDVAIYGGFVGTETLLSQRNFAINPTIISGGGTIQVFRNYSIGNTAILDGVIITNGSAENGGGMSIEFGSSIIIRNCIFSSNHANGAGGGMYIVNSYPTIQNCIFTDNTSSGSGGFHGAGIFLYVSGSEISNCLFYNNRSASGGGLMSYNSNPNIKNSVFYSNRVNTEGGGMYIYASWADSTPTITNCIVYGNTGANTAQLKPGIKYGGLYGSYTTINYSLLQEGVPYISYGNIYNANPEFEDTASPAGADGFWMTKDDGLRVQNNSPCINAGTPGAGTPTTDILGQTRSTTMPTMGAYENLSCAYHKIYVNQNIAESGNGHSWATAKKTIDEAFKAISCANIDTVWVAAGIYVPVATLSMKSGKAIMGGFAGTETLLSQRNIAANATIISGAGLRRVFANSYIDSTAVLDGFTISNGYVTNPNSGAGMYNDHADPVIINCKFINNIVYNNGGTSGGGGMYNSVSSPTITNCIFKANEAQGYNGGAMFNAGANPKINNCVFDGNTAGYWGGAISFFYASAVITNCVFSDNTAERGGAVSSAYYISSGDASGIFTNCTFKGNSASLQGGAIYHVTSSSAFMSLTNCIIYGNNAPIGPGITGSTDLINVAHCNVQGGYGGTNNTNTDPLFVNAANPIGADNVWMTADDGLQVQDQSAAINFGTTGAGIPTKDILGITRSASSPTIGAYENITYANHKIYVNGNIAASGAGNTWATAKKTMQEAFATASSNPIINTIWVAKGTYLPTATLSMKNGISLFGGFLGTEINLNQRNYTANPTIISGNNQRPVFNNSFLNNTAVLDGFIISNGNTTFNGAGMYNSSSSPTIRNSIFKDNVCNSTANEGGGGMFNYYSNPTITNCVFQNNIVNNGLYGGGMHNDNSSPTVNNCIFIGNTVNNVGAGGGMFNYFSNPVINNAVFTGNSVPENEGGGIYNWSSTPLITNSIIYGNTSPSNPNIAGGGNVNYSIIEGGYTGTSNINVDPLFINAALPVGADGKWMTADDGLALLPCSRAINSGTVTTPALPEDIVGKARLGAYDMGAYENQGANIVITASPLCNSSSTLSLLNIPQNIAQYTIQWQSEQETFVDIPGANNISYNAAITANSAFRCKLTCTYSGLVIYSNVARFDLSPDYEVGVPYCQNFDTSWSDFCGEGIGPSTYWKTVNTSGDVDAWWRRDDGSNLAPAWTSNAGAYTPVAQAGAHSARFHSANIAAGLKGSLDLYTNLLNTSTKNLEFYQINTDGTDVLKVYISTDGGTNFTQIGNTAGYGINATWTKFIIDISSYTSTTCIIRFEATSDAGTTDIGLDEVCIAPYSTATITTPPDATICQNATIGPLSVSSSNTAASLSISPSASLSTSTGTGIINFTAAPSATTVYTVTATENISGVATTKTAQFTITVNNLTAPTASISTISPVCKGNAINLTCNTNTGNNFAWTGPNGFSSSVQNPTIPNASTAMIGAYNVTVSEGICSNKASTSIDIIQPPSISAFITPTGCGFSTGAISLTAPPVNGQANRYLWQPGGQTTADISGLAAGNYTVTVTFSNGCFYTQTYLVATESISLSSVGYSIIDAANQSITADAECNRSDGLTIYYQVATKKFVLAIRKNGNNIGTIGDGTFKVESFTTPNYGTGTGTKIQGTKAPYLQNKDWYVMNRYWKVTPTTQPTTNVMVRFYYTATDIADLMGSIPTLQEDDIKFYKINGSYDPNPANEHIGIPEASTCSDDGFRQINYNSTIIDCENYTRTVRVGGKSVDFEVSQFSGGGGGGFSPNGALPLNLISFTGKSTENGNLLNWKTANEKNFSHFEIERSPLAPKGGITSRKFEKIGSQTANESENYEFLDRTPPLGAGGLYRLKMIDLDGKYSYSKIIVIDNKPEKAIIGQVYPNPSTGSANIQINAIENGNWSISVVDVTGKILQTFTKNLSKGSHNISLENLQQGLNYIKIESGKVLEFRKVIKK